MKKVIFGLWLVCGAAGLAQAETVLAPLRKVDVVFVLDTTGSMGGLIEGAKRKIWSIAGAIAQEQPGASLRMGLVAYRDRGDAYVTRVFDLNTDLDRMYQTLLGFQAAGGGDTPEHVLKALNEAVGQMSWSDDPGAFKLVYLVGDAPAHTDYGDTPPLDAILAAATRKGIVVNAVQCGLASDTREEWQHIAQLGQGSYLPIPQDGGVQAVSTPYDARISEISAKLDATMVGYGASINAAAESRSAAHAIAGAAPAEAMAERAAYKSDAGYFGTDDLAQAVAAKKIDVTALRDKDLPADLRGLSAPQKRERVNAVIVQRAALQKELGELNRRRSEEIARRTPVTGDGFDARLIASLKEQMARRADQVRGDGQRDLSK